MTNISVNWSQSSMNAHPPEKTVHVPTGDSQRTAESLAANRGKQVRMAWSPDGVGSEADAYLIQQRVHRHFADAGLARGGWKIAASTPAQFGALGLTRPAVGAVLQRDIRPSGSSLRMDKFVKVGVEAEIAFRVGTQARAATYPLTEHRAASLVSGAMPAFEIIENRYQDLPNMDGATRIADDFLQAACIVGDEVAAWQDIDLASVSGTVSLQGQTISECHSDPAFSAMAAFTFVANLLAELGTPLQPGEIVLTGALHKPVFTEQRGLYEVSIADLGTVAFSLS